MLMPSWKDVMGGIFWKVTSMEVVEVYAVTLLGTTLKDLDPLG
jgi:hypothetical protein